jgi:hypothetical protein
MRTPPQQLTDDVPANRVLLFADITLRASRLREQQMVVPGEHPGQIGDGLVAPRSSRPSVLARV